MRGKDVSQNFYMSIFGITPAYAGKSLNCRRIEHHDEGSPPPMRGKGLCPRSRSHASGITPAYAGKSQHGFYAGTQHLGSPPPMRGKGSRFPYS